MRTRSSSRALVSESVPEWDRNWTASPNPRIANNAPIRMAAPRFRRRFLLSLTESVMSGSGPEHMPTDRRGIAEDPDPEDDHDRRRQLAADAELVTHEHDQGRD